MRVLVLVCGSLGFACLGTMISLFIIGPLFNLSDDGMNTAATILLPAWWVGLMVTGIVRDWFLL